MPKTEDSYGISDTGNWNVAADYVKEKIMKNLTLADEYSKIAIFGSITMQEEIQGSFNIDEMKLTGLRRLLHCLILLIDNSIFAVKQPGSKELLGGHKKVLERITRKLLPTLYTKETSPRRKGVFLKINEERYQRVLEKVLEIKSKINQPLNDNHLIFTSKKEFNSGDFKKNRIDRMINEG